MSNTTTYTVFSTIRELMEREIVPAFGEWAADFDLDAFREELVAEGLIEWVDYPGACQWNGFALTATPEQFWAIADRCTR